MKGKPKAKPIVKVNPKSENKSSIPKVDKNDKSKVKSKVFICFHCKKPGHKFTKCPKVKESLSKNNNCFKCGAPGHRSRDCTSNIEGFPHASCFKCNKKGHISSNCPEKKSQTKCHTCGKVGHVKLDCPQKPKVKSPIPGSSDPEKQDQPQKSKDKKKCFKCGEAGHIGKNCPKIKTTVNAEASSEDEDEESFREESEDEEASLEEDNVCGICGKSDHIKQNCPQFKKWKFSAGISSEEEEDSEDEEMEDEETEDEEMEGEEMEDEESDLEDSCEICGKTNCNKVHLPKMKKQKPSEKSPKALQNFEKKASLKGVSKNPEVKGNSKDESKKPNKLSKGSQLHPSLKEPPQKQQAKKSLSDTAKTLQQNSQPKPKPPQKQQIIKKFLSDKSKTLPQDSQSKPKPPQKHHVKTFQSDAPKTSQQDSQPNPITRKKKCFICHDPSHKQKDCPQLKEMGDKGILKKKKCVHCGKTDHKKRDCPTKQESLQIQAKPEMVKLGKKSLPQQPPPSHQDETPTARKPCSHCGSTEHKKKHCPLRSLEEKSFTVSLKKDENLTDKKSNSVSHSPGHKPCSYCGSTEHKKKHCPSLTSADDASVPKKKRKVSADP